MTGAGGFLQSVWAGYGGIRFEHPGILTIRQPAPLPNSTRLRLRGVHFLGSRLDITAENSGWRVELNGGSVTTATEIGSELEVVDAKSGQGTILTGEQPVQFPKGASAYVHLRGGELPVH